MTRENSNETPKDEGKIVNHYKNKPNKEDLNSDNSEKGSKDKSKDELLTFVKSKLGIGVITGVICFILGSCSSIGAKNELEKVNKNKINVENQLSSANSQIKTLQAKVDQAKPWFDMNEEKQKQEQAKLDAEKKAQAEKEEAERKAKEAAEQAKVQAEKAAKEAEEKKGYNTGITYNQLARTPDDFKGKKVKFNGKVIQVMESDTETDIRLAVNDEYNTIILATIGKGTTKSRVLENDHITIMGKSGGVYTYKSTMGGSITVPLVFVDKIEQ